MFIIVFHFKGRKGFDLIFLGYITKKLILVIIAAVWDFLDPLFFSWHCQTQLFWIFKQ